MALWLASSSAPAIAQSLVAPVIEAYISPPTLFAREGVFEATPGPLPTYTRYKGTAEGFIVRATLNGVVQTPMYTYECPGPILDRVGPDHPCTPLVWRRKGHPDIPLETELWSTDTFGLVTNLPLRTAGGFTWARVLTKGNKRGPWVKVPSDHAYSWESLARKPSDELKVICTKPDRNTCQAAHSGWRKDLSLAHQAILKTIQSHRYLSLMNVYNIESIHHDGRYRYYRLELEAQLGDLLQREAPEILPLQRSLPQTIFIPTRNSDGTHSGSPGGC